jgi:hypothetical protein
MDWCRIAVESMKLMVEYGWRLNGRSRLDRRMTHQIDKG